MRKPRLYMLMALAALSALLFSPETLLAAGEPLQYNVGGVKFRLKGPSGHSWVNKDAELGLKFAPERYELAIEHMLSLYQRESGGGSLARLYNNYGAVFYIGPVGKIWTENEFAELKKLLLPTDENPDPAGRPEEVAFLRRFLQEGLGYEISDRKARKYYSRLQQATVLRDAKNSVALGLRHKKKGEKDKNVTMSLALLRGKLLGTLYYQVEPGRTERQRAAEMTMAWQDALLASNSQGNAD